MNLRTGWLAGGKPRCYERDSCAARDSRTDYRADFNADGFAYQRHAFRDTNLDANSHRIANRYGDEITNRYTDAITDGYSDGVTNRYADRISNADTC
jgi:hypothetical protein